MSPSALRTLLMEGVAALRGVYLATPLLLSIAGAVLLLVAEPTLVSAVGAAGLVALGVLTGRSLTRHHERTLEAVERAAEAEIARVTGLCAQSAPVWIRQIETVRSEADTEVGELARLFGDIAGKLDNVMGVTRLGETAGGVGEQEILDALASNGRDLQKLVESLGQLQTSKHRIVQEIGAEAARLKDNAAEIRQIALHIRMVSLNATIEAARAGPAGKPFGVIVADMRELAVRTAEASELFSRHTDRLHHMVSAAFEEQEQSASGAASIAAAEAAVQQVLRSSEAMMRQLTQAIAAMEHERRDVREDISRALVALQFQDRVSQILSHVTGNLQEMQSRIQAGQWNAMDDGHWLQRMSIDYSTHEEFGNHDPSQASVAPAASGVTFF